MINKEERENCINTLNDFIDIVNVICTWGTPTIEEKKQIQKECCVDTQTFNVLRKLSKLIEEQENRIKELEEIEKEHQRLIGELEEKLTKAEED